MILNVQNYLFNLINLLIYQLSAIKSFIYNIHSEALCVFKFSKYLQIFV